MRMLSLEGLRCPSCFSTLVPVRVAVENRPRCKSCGKPIEISLPEELVEII
ncbi:MAG: hypothetical protein QXH26_01600 [Candidatus Hadarchaeales archaeon]